MTDYENTPEGRRTAQIYADIIHMERPASKRPKMDLTHRAKIFSPYDSLRGFDEAIDETAAQGQRVQKVLLSEEETSVLSQKLSQVRKGMQIEVEYFAGDADGKGNYRIAKGTVVKVDPVGEMLELEENKPDTTGGKIEKVLPTRVRFEDILDVNGSKITDATEIIGD